ncbi:MAG: carbohydrate kinase [Armatimonadetes bacterium]|nr:carbohydrate kinase [Armatimonadota bacterium]
MDSQRLEDLVNQFTSRRVVVIGDYFLDKYLDFDPNLAEVSVETGKTANQVVNIRHSPGAAGTVVSNLVALGAGEVVPVGFTGDDGEAYDLRKDLQTLGCSTSYLLRVPNRFTPTYLKPMNCRLSGLEAESERFDTKNRVPLPSDVEASLADIIESLAPQADAVVIADQVEEKECGVITSRMRNQLADLATRYPDVVFWADSRRRIGLFQNVIIKPNQHEAVRATLTDSEVLPTDEAILVAGRTLTERTRRPVFITRAEKGMLIFDEHGYQEVPGVPAEGPIDPTGAGDSATAGAVLTLACGGTLVEAAIVANLTASITIQQIGTTGKATPAELLSRLEDWRRQF